MKVNFTLLVLEILQFLETFFKRKRTRYKITLRALFVSLYESYYKRKCAIIKTIITQFPLHRSKKKKDSKEAREKIHKSIDSVQSQRCRIKASLSGWKKEARENNPLKWWGIGRWRCHGGQQLPQRKTGKRAQWSRRTTIHSCNHSPDRQLDAPQGWNRKPLSPSILETWQPRAFFFLSFLSLSLTLSFFFILSTFDTCACTTRVRACVHAFRCTSLPRRVQMLPFERCLRAPKSNYSARDHA